MSKSIWSLCKRLTFNCFFVNKQTNDNLPFAQWANGQRIKENRMDFRFPFSLWNSAYKYIYKYKYKHTHTKKGYRRKQHFLFVCCNQKWKTKFVFPWSANDRWQLIIAVSDNMSHLYWLLLFGKNSNNLSI